MLGIRSSSHPNLNEMVRLVDTPLNQDMSDLVWLSITKTRARKEYIYVRFHLGSIA